MQPIRLSTPADLVAAVPLLTGFVPAESLLVLSLREPRGRVGLTMRVDLPPPSAYGEVVDALIPRLLADGATRAATVIYTSAPDVDGELPCTPLAALLDLGFERAGLVTKDVLLVRAGRWWSYLCSEPDCCPSEGTPIVATEAATHAAAQHALEGGTVLPSREDLARSLAPTPALGLALVERRFQLVDTAVADDILLRGLTSVRQDGLAMWRSVLDRFAAPPAKVDEDECAQLVVRLADRQVRDEVLTEALDRGPALFGLLHALVRATPPSYDPEVCCLFAWVAALRGDGGLANIALDRALLAEPEHSLSALLRTALDGQLLAGQLRSTLLDVRRIMQAGGAAPPQAPSARRSHRQRRAA